MGRVPALGCGLNCSQATLAGTPSSRMCVELSSVAFAQGPSVKDPSACGAAAPADGAGAGACTASAQKGAQLRWKVAGVNTEFADTRKVTSWYCDRVHAQEASQCHCLPCATCTAACRGCRAPQHTMCPQHWTTPRMSALSCNPGLYSVHYSPVPFKTCS